MPKVLKTRIVNIGNSRGIRIPKVLLDQLGLSTEVELSVQSDQLVIRSTRHPRAGWDEQLREMAARGDDRTRDDYVPTEWDDQEWEWE